MNERSDGPELVEQLTPRQREILAMIAAGRTNAEIAESLGLTLDGAKYHVREILNKLGADSREEAVAAWRARSGAPARLRKLMHTAWGAPAMVKGAFAAALVAGGGLAAAVAIAAGEARSDGPPPAALSTANATPTATPVTASATPADGPVGFRVCATMAWQRPSMNEMADVFALTRFTALSGGTVAPALFAYYLAPAVELYPWANSANIEPSSISGLNTVLRAQPSATDPACGSGHLANGDLALFNAVWVFDYRVVEARKEGTRLVLTVASDPGRAQYVYVPDPPPTMPGPPSKGGQEFFGEIALRTGDGRLIQDDSGASSIAYDQARRLLYLVTDARGPRPFAISYDRSAIAVYSTAGSDAVAILRDSAGAPVPLGPSPNAPAGWVNVGVTTLDAGEYTLEVQGEQARVLVLPLDTPLP